jgi:hypothetical protein
MQSGEFDFGYAILWVLFMFEAVQKYTTIFYEINRLPFGECVDQGHDRLFN